MRKMIPISLAVLLIALAAAYTVRANGVSTNCDEPTETTEKYSDSTEYQIDTETTNCEPYIVEIPVGAEDTYISEEIQNECIAVGDERGYCPELLMAIIESESSGRQYAENGSCKGLMQINMSNSDVVEYMEEQGYTDIFDIHTNIEMGCYVLDQKRAIFDDDLYAVLMSYNGSKNVRERVENEDYTYYAIHIVDRSYELERIHGK